MNLTISNLINWYIAEFILLYKSFITINQIAFKTDKNINFVKLVECQSAHTQAGGGYYPWPDI
jgi:hypothetical protein